MVSIRKELEGYGIAPRKKWGQHFLVDRNILHKVIQTAGIEGDDTVLEVGPGLGEMTLALSQKAGRVIAVEIDPKLVKILGEKIAGLGNVEVLEGDILEFDFRRLLRKGEEAIKVVANLPYQISTPLLFRFIETREIFSSLTLMLQREVAERVVACPGMKAYGTLSILVQSVADVSIRFFLKRTVFFPPPRVESALIHITWKERPVVGPQDEGWFRDVVRGCFRYRRKTILNAIKHSGLALSNGTEMRMEEAGIDPGRRPETLSIEEFIRLARTLRT